MGWKNFFSKEKLPESEIDYDYYFKSGTHGDVHLSCITLGALNVPSGRILVADPLVYLFETEPYNIEVKPGAYPVILAIAQNEGIGERVALAKLQLSEKRSKRWVLALSKDNENKVKELEKDSYFGFPVDAGLGSFCDERAKVQYENFHNEFYQSNPNGNIYDDYFAEKFQANATKANDPGDWLDFTIPGSQNNIIMFSSGFGDGYYPAYWGYDSDNKLASLVIDFQLFGD